LPKPRSQKGIEDWQHAVVDVFRDPRKLSEISVLDLDRSTAEIEPEEVCVGLESDGSDENSLQTEKACLPHCINDLACELPRGMQRRTI
jgi:hypothetical protein